MSEANKTLVRRILEDLWNQKNPALIDELFAPTAAWHTHDGVFHGPAGVRQLYTLYTTAFPDVHVTMVDMVAEGEKVAAYYTVRGTHTGALRDLAPTGQRVTVEEMMLTRVAGGQVVESWTVWDTLRFMQQLGLIPQRG
jgi:predicted ester cyclase